MKIGKLNETIEDFDLLREEILIKHYDSDYLYKKSNYKEYKIVEKGDMTYHVFIGSHLEDQFVKRFVVGDEEATWRLGDTKFNELEGWKSLGFVDLYNVLDEAIDVITNEYRGNMGAYMIISRSKKIVVPTILGSMDRKKDESTICFNTVLHTVMGRKRFYYGNPKKEYEFDKVFTEAKDIEIE